MRYTVTSLPRAHNKLALIWIQAADQNAVKNASDAIDAALATSPLTEGEEHGNCRVFTIDPLTVIYKVSPDDCWVSILDYTYHG